MAHSQPTDKGQTVTGLIMSYPAGKVSLLPSRSELRAMLLRPSVIIAAIAAATLIVLSLFGGLILLGLYGRSTEALVGVFSAILGLFSTTNIGLSVALWQRLKSVEANTNGNVRQLQAAVIASPPLAPSTPDSPQ